MQITSFKPTIKSKEVSVPSFGEGAVICVFENTVASALRLQKLLKLLKDNDSTSVECHIAAMLIVSMRKPDGSYILPDDNMETVNLVAYQTNQDALNDLYEAYGELNPIKELKEGEKHLGSKKKKS